MLTVHSKDSLFIFLASLNGKKKFLFQGQGRGRSLYFTTFKSQKVNKGGSVSSQKGMEGEITKSTYDIVRHLMP